MAKFENSGEVGLEKHGEGNTDLSLLKILSLAYHHLFSQ